MSKRFGRNQKRKLNKKLARQKEKLQYLQLNFSHTKTQNRLLQQREKQIADTIEKLCPNSVLLPPKENYGDTRHPTYTLPIYEEVNLYNTSPMDAIFDAENYTYKQLNLYKLEIYIRDNIENFTKAVHLMLHNKGHSVYYLTEQALANLPQEILIRELIPDITKKLVNSLKEGLKK